MAKWLSLCSIVVLLAGCDYGKAEVELTQKLTAQTQELTAQTLKLADQFKELEAARRSQQETVEQLQNAECCIIKERVKMAISLFEARCALQVACDIAGNEKERMEWNAKLLLDGIERIAVANGAVTNPDDVTFLKQPGVTLQTPDIPEKKRRKKKDAVEAPEECISTASVKSIEKQLSKGRALNCECKQYGVARGGAPAE